MDLMGLAPEQIDALTRTDIAQNSVLVNAANALADRNAANAQTQAYTQAHTPRYAKISLDGREWTVPEDKIPEMYKNLSDAKRADSLMVTVDNNGKPVQMNSSTLPGFINALTLKQKAPSEIAKNQALTGLYGTQTEDINRMAIANLTAKQNEGALRQAQADQASVETHGKETQHAAVFDLQNVPPDKWLTPEYAATAATAFPNITAALANKFQPGKEISIDDKREAITAMTKINPDNLTPGDVAGFNVLANEINFPAMLTQIEDKPVYVTLPIVQGTQMTPRMVTNYAKARGISVDQALAIINSTKQGE